MINKFGGRKVVLGVAVMTIGILIDIFVETGLTPNVLDLLKFVAVGFFLGNGIEHIAKAVKGKKPPNSDLKPLSMGMDRIANDTAKVASAQIVLSEQIAVNQKQVAQLSNLLGANGE